MIYNYIALAFLLLSLAGIIFIIVKKLPQIKTIDVATIAEEKEARVRDRIMLERLERRTKNGKKFLTKIFTPLTQVVKNLFISCYEWLVSLEKKYQAEAQKPINPRDPEFATKVKRLLEEAGVLVKKEKFSDAEKKYIEVISLSSKSREAYQGLAELYLVQKEYNQAIQTLQYILKLDSKPSDNGQAQDLNRDYLRLGDAYAASGQLFKAFEQYKQALDLVNNDPKTLDLLIETAMLLRDKLAALEYFKKLQEVNPENQKLAEIQMKITDMDV